MATTEERLSRIEGGYEHLATKADIAEVKTEIAETKAEFKLVKWGVGLLTLLSIAMLAGIFRFLGN